MDPEGKRLENHKSIVFLGKTSLDSLENHKAIASIQCWANMDPPANYMVFSWQADDGPLLVVYWCILRNTKSCRDSLKKQFDPS